MIDDSNMVWSNLTPSPVQVSVPLCSLAVSLSVATGHQADARSAAVAARRAMVLGPGGARRLQQGLDAFDLRGARVPTGVSRAAGVVVVGR